MAFVESLIGAGSGMTGSAITAGTSAIIDKRNRDFQLSMYNQQLADQREDVLRTREWQEEMYNKYDSPAAKYAQFSALGINPNTIADMLGEGVGLSPSVPVSNPAPSVPSTPLSYLGQSVGNFASDMLSSVKVGAEIEKMRQETQSMAIDNQTREERNRISLDEARSIIDRNKAERDRLISEVGLNESEKRRVDELLPYMIAKSDVEIQEINSTIATYNQQIEELKHRIGLLDQQVATERHKQHNLDASSELLGQQKSSEYQNTKLLETENELKARRNELDKVESAYKAAMYENGLEPGDSKSIWQVVYRFAMHMANPTTRRGSGSR